MRYEVMNGQPADVAVRRVTAPQTSYAFLHAAYIRPSHQLERHPDPSSRTVRIVV